MRYNVAAQLVDLCGAMGQEITRMELTPVFVRLLCDSEAEVRVSTRRMEECVLSVRAMRRVQRTEFCVTGATPLFSSLRGP